MSDVGAFLEKNGMSVVPSVLAIEEVARFREKIDEVLLAYSDAQTKHKLDQLINGAIHHLPVFDSCFLELLLITDLSEVVKGWFKGNSIVNSFGGVVNSPGGASYVHAIHRDTRFYCGEYRLFLNLLIALDDFTLENGATLIMPKKNVESSMPTLEDFERHAEPQLLSAGDALIFDSNLWHRAGYNRSKDKRRCITITFSRPWVKQQFNYSKLCEESSSDFSKEVLQALGYFARTPSAIDDWLRPEEERFYSKGQDA